MYFVILNVVIFVTNEKCNTFALDFSPNPMRGLTPEIPFGYAIGHSE